MFDIYPILLHSMKCIRFQLCYIFTSCSTREHRYLSLKVSHCFAIATGPWIWIHGFGAQNGKEACVTAHWSSNRQLAQTLDCIVGTPGVVFWNLHRLNFEKNNGGSKSHTIVRLKSETKATNIVQKNSQGVPCSTGWPATRKMCVLNIAQRACYFFEYRRCFVI